MRTSVGCGRLVRSSRGNGRMKRLLVSVAMLGSLSLTLTASPASAVFAGEGNRVLFFNDSTGSAQVYSINPLTKGVNPLTPGPSESYPGHYSPNGNKIAYFMDAGVDFDIFMMKANGSNNHPVLSDVGDELWPAFAPNGKQFVYVFEDPSDGYELYVANADGSGPHQISMLPELPEVPVWAPNRKRIAFTMYDGNDLEIYTI